jgi:hypothetical protein
MIWTTQPDAIDLRSSNHLLNRFERSRIADTKLSSLGGSCLGVRRVWTVHTKHIRIANAAPGFKMKLRTNPLPMNPIPSLLLLMCKKSPVNCRPTAFGSVRFSETNFGYSLVYTVSDEETRSRYALR